MVLFLKNVLFTLVVPGTVAGYLPWFLVRDVPFVASSWTFVAAAFFAVGLAVFLRCVYDFAVTGGGTPAPVDEPKRLVVVGLYRVVRNPMYVGVLCVLAGWASLYRSPGISVYALAVAAAFHLFVVLYEEPHLERVFGESYTAYRSSAGRWLPRISRESESPSRRGPRP